MKYKNIDSMLHNLGHSFCSDTNIVMKDGVFENFVFKEINKIFLQNSVLAEFYINISTQEIIPNSASSFVIEASVQKYKQWLPEHINNHSLNLEKIHNITLRFIGSEKRSSKAFKCTVTCTDDKGKEYSVEVK